MLGGGEIALLNLLRHLSHESYQPVVLLFMDGPLAWRLREAGVETHILPLSPNVIHASKDALGGKSLTRVRDIFDVFRHVGKVAGFIRAHRIDLIHTNSLKADIIGGLAARLAGRPVIWHIRDRIANDYLPRSVVVLFRWLCGVIPHYVLANSLGTLRTVVRSDRANAMAVPSGVDLRGRVHLVHDGTQAAASITVIGSANKDPLIGLVGRLTPWKGQHVFLRAAARIAEKYPDARFQIIGAALFSEHEYESQIRNLARELGLENRVEFTGFRENVPELIAQLTILVHASTTGEPFGQVVIEGMAASKPVVATNGGGIPEIVIDGVTGLLVRMGDSEAMADAILRLLADPNRAMEMGRLGRQRVVANFTIERTASQVAEIYAKILHRRVVDHAKPSFNSPQLAARDPYDERF